MPAALYNAAVAAQLDAFAALLDLAETTPTRARAYRRAAATIRPSTAGADPRADPRGAQSASSKGDRPRHLGTAPRARDDRDDRGSPRGARYHPRCWSSCSGSAACGASRLAGWSRSPQRSTSSPPRRSAAWPRATAALGCACRGSARRPSARSWSGWTPRRSTPRRGLTLTHTPRQLVEGVAEGARRRGRRRSTPLGGLSFDLLGVVVPSSRPEDVLDAFRAAPADRDRRRAYDEGSCSRRDHRRHPDRAPVPHAGSIRHGARSCDWARALRRSAPRAAPRTRP